MSEFVVIIPADQSQRVSVRELPPPVDDQGTLSFFQQIVGGYIEVVPALLLNDADPRFADVSICLNEEGKLVGLPHNGRASAWCAPLHDSILGDVALIGPPDDEGNTTGFDELRASQLARRVGRL